MHLTSVGYIAWFGSLFAEGAIIGIMLTRKLAGRFPFFFAAITYDIVRQIALISTLLLSPNRNAYFYAYWLSVPLEYAFAFAVIYEVYQHTFRADIKFSPKTMRRFAALTVLLAVVSAAFVFSPGAHIQGLSSLILVLDRSAELMRCGLLVFIWVFAAQLGISWRHHLWGIVLGLGLYSAVGLITAAVDVATGEMCRHWLVPIPHFAYFGATILWPIYFCRKEPERGPLTPEKVRFYSDLLASLRKAAIEIRRAIRDNNH